MKLNEKLNELQVSGQFFGICPFRDGEGELWGRVIEVKEKSFIFEEVSPLGAIEEKSEFRFDQIHYLDLNSEYADRLKLLNGFKPTSEAKYEYETKRSRVKTAITESARTGEVIRVQLLGDASSQTVKIVSVDGKWVEIQQYDGLMKEWEVSLYKMSAILAVRRGTASEECEAYLLSKQ